MPECSAGSQTFSRAAAAVRAQMGPSSDERRRQSPRTRRASDDASRLSQLDVRQIGRCDRSPHADVQGAKVSEGCGEGFVVAVRVAIGGVWAEGVGVVPFMVPNTRPQHDIRRTRRTFA